MMLLFLIYLIKHEDVDIKMGKKNEGGMKKGSYRKNEADVIKMGRKSDFGVGIQYIEIIYMMNIKMVNG